jgi:hypothetical protein
MSFDFDAGSNNARIDIISLAGAHAAADGQIR